MAERTITIKECDRLTCRKRKGVAAVEVVVQFPGEPEPSVYRGDLCPYHIEQLKGKITSMFDIGRKKWNSNRKAAARERVRFTPLSAR